MLRKWFTGLFIGVSLVLGPVAFAQDPTPTPPGVEQPAGEMPSGNTIDAFQLFALPAIALIVAAVGQVLKLIVPNTVIDTGLLTGGVRVLFGIGFIVAVFFGVEDKLVGGVDFLNQLSPLILQIISVIGTALALWFGPSAIYEGAKARNITFLGQSQGKEWFRFEKKENG